MALPELEIENRNLDAGIMMALLDLQNFVLAAVMAELEKSFPHLYCLAFGALFLAIKSDIH